MKTRAYLLMLPLAVAASSCSAIYDDSDCTDSYNEFQLHYDYNLKQACATDLELKEATLMAFNSETGLLAWTDHAKAADWGEEHVVRAHLEPGEYDLLVWGGAHARDYQMATPVVGQTRLQDMHCTVGTAAYGEEGPESLFHGLKHVSLKYAANSAPDRHEIFLTKDTNTVRILLQNLSGEELSADDFNYEITDCNSALAHNNELHSSASAITYKPYKLYSGKTAINNGSSSISAALAEMKVNRLFADSDATLRVTRASDGEEIISIPLVQYLLMVKGFDHADMPDQEYLDRQDEYNLTFFLDSRLNWITSHVMINEWTVVPVTVEAK